MEKWHKPAIAEFHRVRYELTPDGMALRSLSGEEMLAAWRQERQDDENEQQRAHKEQLRIKAIRRFTRRQTRARRWLSFPQIVDALHSQDPSCAEVVIYDELADSVEHGDLAAPWLFLSDPSLPRRMTADLVRGARMADRNPLTENSQPCLINDWLVHCWISAASARRWLTRHDYAWPPNFEPAEGAPSTRTGARKKPAKHAARSRPSALAVKEKVVEALHEAQTKGDLTGQDRIWDRVKKELPDVTRYQVRAALRERLSRRQGRPQKEPNQRATK
jgi:hypothetical protein